MIFKEFTQSQHIETTEPSFNRMRIWELKFSSTKYLINVLTSKCADDKSIIFPIAGLNICNIVYYTDIHQTFSLRK